MNKHKIEDSPIIYLAQPYTHPDPAIVKRRFELGEQYTAELLVKQQWVYSPIVHCHELAAKYSLPTNFDYWKTYNQHMINRASVFYAMLLSGWKDSRGMYNEIVFANMSGLPFHYIEIHDNKFINKAADVSRVLSEFHPKARS